MSRPRLHGTDGIRGKVVDSIHSENPIENLILQRELSASVMRIAGKATGLVLGDHGADLEHPRPDGHIPLVVVGWDRRPRNAELVDALEQGLVEGGCRVQRVGEVPTPGLHHCLLEADADGGMMVTASHNPASDSGVKLFDRHGYKSMPALEDRISEVAWDLAADASDTGEGGGGAARQTLDEIDGQRAYRMGLKRRLELFEQMFGMDFKACDWSDVVAPIGLLLDSSGGAATDWLAAGISQRGLLTVEVSDREQEINWECGAGGLSPTDSWSHEQLVEDIHHHALIRAVADRLRENDGMPPWEEGQLVGAALDGDGDRCLLLEASGDGVRVVDGDRMADDILRAAHANGMTAGWTLACTIETDLALPASLDRFHEPVDCIQTAVGDRWLAHALMPQDEAPGRLLRGDQIPARIGCEDSGHLVMPAPHPTKPQYWSLVGDGAATLLSVLCARASLAQSSGPTPVGFKSGWKRRVSVIGAERERWDGQNELADEVERFVRERLSERGELTDWHRVEVAGEPALLLLEGRFDGAAVSVGVRNSGTEAKTSASIRMSGDTLDGNILDGLAVAVSTLLAQRLIP